MCSQHVHTMRLPMRRNADWEQWLLVIADVHWDNPLCRRDLLKRHLDEARQRNARVFVIGDLFCLMNGKYDPRRSLGKVRPEHKSDDYLDVVIDRGPHSAASWFEPWADLFELVTPGNHETAVLKSCGTDPTARFAEAIGCEAGTYQGWVRMMFDDGPYRTSRTTRYHHGHGGGGVVTKGTLWPQRRAAWWPDADLVVSGHIHEQWSFPIARERLTEAGEIRQDIQLHLCLPTYKSESSEGSGFAVEKGFSPRPLGGWWVRLTYHSADGAVRMEEMRAA